MPCSRILWKEDATTGKNISALMMDPKSSKIFKKISTGKKKRFKEKTPRLANRNLNKKNLTKKSKNCSKVGRSISTMKREISEISTRGTTTTDSMSRS